MDLTQLANLGEFIGGVAVLVTLVYLAVQVRQNTIAIKRSNVREVTREHVRAITYTDPELSEIMMRGWADLEALTPLERYRFDLIAYAWLAAIEQAFADHDSGHFPDDSMVIFRNTIPGVVGAEGGLRWWSERPKAGHPSWPRTGYDIGDSA